MSVERGDIYMVNLNPVQGREQAGYRPVLVLSVNAINRLPLVVAVYSAIKRHSVLAGLAVLGDLSIQGNIKSVRSLAEPLQVAMDNGARRALVPLENKRNFLEVSGDIVERVDPIFFSDPMTDWRFVR